MLRSIRRAVYNPVCMCSKNYIHQKGSTVKRENRIFKHQNNRLVQTSSHLFSENDQAFMDVYPEIFSILTYEGKDIALAIKKYYIDLLGHIPSFPKTSALMTVKAYEIFETSHLTTEKLKLANVMGWCIQLLQGYFLMIDKAIVGANSRCPIESSHENMNDIFLVKEGVYYLIKIYFSNHPCYSSMFELFRDVSIRRSMSRVQDYEKKTNFDLFTMSRYNTIVKQKTGPTIFHLPVGAAMYMANLRDAELHKQAKNASSDMGMFFQIQDDFLEYFGSSETSTSDKLRGRLSWMAVTALQKTNPAQRKLLEELYEKNDPTSHKLLCDLYKELGVPKMYATFIEESFQKNCCRIRQLPAELPRDLFINVMDNIYNRDIISSYVKS